MATITFYKYQATGNDFVIIDNRKGVFDGTATALVERLCDRRFGIGADGLILIQNHEKYDFEMVYYNADGNIGSLCGNGGRAAVKFCFNHGVISANKTTFQAYDGPHTAEVLDNGWVKLQMNDVSQIEVNEDYYWLDTGSPHYVTFIDAAATYPVFEKGKAIRNNSRFAEKGTNVNFVEKTGDQSIYVRTYERGVENETLSCGTGVTAAAIAAGLSGLSSPIAIKTLGGSLKVEFEKNGAIFQALYLSGPAEEVFQGVFSTESQ